MPFLPNLFWPKHLLHLFLLPAVLEEVQSPSRSVLQNAVLILAAPFLKWFCDDAGQGAGVDDDVDDDDDDASSHPHLCDLYAVYGPCDHLCAHGDDDYGVGVDVFPHLHI